MCYMGFHEKLRKYARTNNGVVTDDPEGLLAALSISKRLMLEDKVPFMEALENAIPRAAVIDPERTWWSAYRLMVRHLGDHAKGAAHDGMSVIDALGEAIRNQGRVNVFQKKGIRP